MQSGRPIILRGVKVHNLRSIDLDLPSRKLIVFCGVSGSGKSSLAFDTLYAEGQRRYLIMFTSPVEARGMAGFLGNYAVVEIDDGRIDVTEFGRVPDEMEHLRTVAHPTDAEHRLHLFRFRMHAPHWSAARGWMVGVGGTHTYTCYAAEDECSLAEHVTALLAALAEWPDRRGLRSRRGWPGPRR